jgi:hypothetical protein
MIDDRANGGEQDHDPVDNAELLARIMVLSSRIESVIVETTKTREAAQRSEAAIKDVRSALRRVANDQMELRTGIPHSWRRRIVLVAAAALIGSVCGSAIVATSATTGQPIMTRRTLP